MSKLRSTLATLFQHALLNPGQPIKTKLKNGLVICLTATMPNLGSTGLIHPPKNNYLILNLHRAKVYPSATEWNTVLNHFPFLTGAAVPTKLTNNGTFTFRAAIPIQERLL